MLLRRRVFHVAVVAHRHQQAQGLEVDVAHAVRGSSRGAGWPRALTNHLLHTSYGMAALYNVLWETVDGVAQGGVVKFPLKFDSGIQRARFNPQLVATFMLVGFVYPLFEGIASTEFSQHDLVGAPAHVFCAHDFVGVTRFEHTVLVNA